MINWRSLLSELRVDWSDRGPNRSAGQITIRCPWCGDADPSRHLAIDEATGQYFCFRNSRHAGKSAPYLLRGLGVNGSLIDTYLTQYGGRSTPVKRQDDQPVRDFHWDRYLPAANNPKMLQYLEERGIARPAEAARIFDLRYAQAGEYAQRILMPIHQPDGKIGFTGRAILPRLTPKYLTHEAVKFGVYVPYLPWYIAEKFKSFVIVEGPFDALKLAWSLMGDSPPEAVVASLLGLALPPARVRSLIELARRSDQVLVALDSDQPVSVAYQIIRELSSHLQCRVVRCPMPGGVKDPGEMQMQELRLWYNQHAQNNAHG